MGRILFLLVLVACFEASAAEQARPLYFGVLNQQSPARTAERWNPILAYLAEATGLRFQLRMGATVRETDAMMGRGEFDFLFSNHNFRREFDGQYRVLARWAGSPVYGVIAVREGSAATSLANLEGRRVAFPSREAFVAYAVPMEALRSARVRVDVVTAGSQEGALTQLQAKQVDAAAVNSRFLTRFAAQTGLRYREIYVSEAYAEMPVVVHPRVPREHADMVRRALLAMADDPRAAAAREAAGSKGFHPADERDYDNVRRVYARSRE